MKIENINEKIINNYNNQNEYMTVYRICNKKEIKKVINNSFKKIGKKNLYKVSYNTHNYDKNKYYLHFFETKEDAFRLANTSKRYLCTYTIALDILESSKGLGNYIDEYGYYKLEKVIEYAIESKQISKDNLASVELLDKDLCKKIYIEGKTIKDNSKVLYKKR